MTKNKIEIVQYTDQDSHIRGVHANEARELKRVLSHLVEEKIAEATGGPTAIFQPFFQTPRIMKEIKHLQSVPEQRKYFHYFDRWGCLAGCGATKETARHAHLGMCEPCYRRIRARLLTVVRELTPATPQDERFSDSVERARAAFDPSVRLLPPGEPEEKKRLYTQREAAAAAGIHPKTLYIWLRDGEVRPSVQASEKRFLWTDADIEELKLLKSKNASHHGSKASKARWAKPQEVEP